MTSGLVVRFILVCASLATAAPLARGAEPRPVPALRRQGDATQLIVDGKPMLMLAGELHNSSASSPEYCARLFPKLKALNLNSVLATASWELIEPEEGKFDFSSVDALLRLARENDLRVGLLWFGSWKNGVSSYCPEWVKRDTRRFPRARGSSGRNVKTLVTPLSGAARDADARAFAALMRHLKEFDAADRTVILVQVENETGMMPEPRDLSEQADALFAGPVPGALTDYLAAHRERLVPEFRAAWEKAGAKTDGAWADVFGPGPQADEAFGAWQYATYVNAVVRAGKAEYALPMYVNAWLRAPGNKPGNYPSGGPTAHVLDVWRAAAPDVDAYAPDIYLGTFKEVCAEYTFGGNALVIPEASTDVNAVSRAFWAFGRHDAICFSPFGIDHVRPDHPLADGYAVLRQLTPLIAAAQGTGKMAGIYQQSPAEDGPDQPLPVGTWRANIRYNKPREPRDGQPRPEAPAPYGLIIQTADEEFVVAGRGFQVNFSPTTPGPAHAEILSAEMGHFDAAGQWVNEMRLNGDETGANHMAELPPNPGNSFLDPSRPRILKVRVYRYD